MSCSESEVIRASCERIAHVFGIPVDTVRPEQEFGTDLATNENSDFRYGELDQILHDVRDVADKQTIRKLNSGSLVIRTVDDYCKHMLHCYRTNEREVLNALGLKIDQD